MLALCREHRVEHRTKHIALRYFLARELQQRGQLRLAYVASEANTADIFTKALPPACFALLDWSCDLLFSYLYPTHLLVHSFLILSQCELVGGPVRLLALSAAIRNLATPTTPPQLHTTTPALPHPAAPHTRPPVDRGPEPCAFEVGFEFETTAAATLGAARVDAAAEEGGAVAQFLEAPMDAAPGLLTAAAVTAAAAVAAAAIVAAAAAAAAAVKHVYICVIVWRVAICTCSQTGRHLATFARAPRSSLYTLTTSSRSAPLSPQLHASAQVATQCECRRLSHDTLLWHHRLGHPSQPRLRSMHSRLLVSGLPRSLPPLPPSPAPPCIPCVEGRQRATPHSSSFPPTEAPLQTLHLDVWGPARVRGQGHERYFLLVVDDYTRYTTVFPWQRKEDVPDVLIPWIRATRLQLRERFQSDFPVLRLHSDRGGEFSSYLLAAFCAEHGIRQTFMLPASPQQNGVAERRIGLVMEVARTSMIHAATPHFLWPSAVRYAAHQLNLWPCVSLPETSPTLLWTGKVGDASCFRVWGARAFVRDTTADKLSPCAIPCVFLGLVPDAPGWQFYDPASRRVFASQDVTFDESVPFYRLFPYRTAPWPPPPLFLAPGPPQVDPVPAPGLAPSGVSQVDPPAPAPVEVTGDSGPAASGAVPWGVDLGGVELGDAESGGAERVEPGGAEPAREEPGGAVSRGTTSGGAAPVCAEPGGAESGGESPEGSETAVPRSPWSSRLRPLVPLTSQQLHDWYGRRQRPTFAPQGSPAGGSSAGVAGPGGARTGSAGAAGAGGGAAGGPVATGGAGAAEGTGAAGGAGAAGAAGAAGGAGAARGAGAAGGARAAGGTGAAGGACATRAGGPAQPRLFFAPPSLSSQPPPDSALCQVLSLPSSTGLLLQHGSPLPAPSPYTEQPGGLAERREPASRPVSPVCTGRRVPRQSQPAVSGPPLVVRRPSSPSPRVPLPPPPASSLPVVADPASDRFRAVHSTVTRLLATVVTDPSFESAAASALVTELVAFAAHCRLDYAASLVADTAFLQGSLHEEIWLRRPPGFTVSFSPGTLWSLRRPVYGLRQAPREWHDTLRTTLAALGFAPSTADPSRVCGKALPPGDHLRFCTLLGLVPSLPHLL
ncbi:unnamed protein product [Closterium sp. NIES-53]